MIDILTIKYWNSVQVMSTNEVLSYDDAKWPDKNLPFSFPKFNREKFNFIESPTENYIVFFALKYMGFWSDDLKDDILWKKIVEDLKKS